MSINFTTNFQIVLPSSTTSVPLSLDNYEDVLKGAVDVVSPQNSEECAPESFADRRWWLVAILGTSLSVVSLFCNFLIANILLRRQYSQFYFLGLLALSDLFLSACYGPVIAMDIIKNRLRILWLTRLWWSYVGPLLSLCHVSMTFSSFMIILGTIERYLITYRKSSILAWFRGNRWVLALSMFFLALILRGTAFFEINVVKNGQCTGLTEYTPDLTPLTRTWLYGTVFRFYIRNITTVFIPFFLLSWLNFRIVDFLRRQKRSATMFRFGSSSEHKIRARAATRLLVLITCSYLMANFLNVVITSWEYIDLESTTETEFTFAVYETLTDVISVLYILVCATRLPVYLTCNEEIRSAFYDHLCSMGPFSILKTKRKASNISSNSCKSIPADVGSLDSPLPAHLEKVGTDFDRVVMAMAFAKKFSKRNSELSENPREYQHQNDRNASSANNYDGINSPETHRKFEFSDLLMENGAERSDFKKYPTQISSNIVRIVENPFEEALNS